MQILVSIITLSLIITPLVVLHELGHYLTAKYFKVRVLEFGLGFPPKIFSFWTQEIEYSFDNSAQINSKDLDKDQIIYVELSENRIIYLSKKNISKNYKHLIPLKIIDIFEDKIKVKTMNWSINLIPFGGFVKLFGEEKNNSKDSLSSSSYLGRFIIIFSGSFINFLLPFIMMFCVSIFIVEKNISDIIVQQVMPNSPADIAGLRSGDKIVSINNQKIFSIVDLQNEISQNLGKKSDWEIVRGIPNLFQKPGENNEFYYDDKLSENYNILARWDPPVNEIGVDISLEKARTINPYAGTINFFEITNSTSKTTISLEDAKKYSNLSIGEKLPIVLNNEANGIPLDDARKINYEAGVIDEIREGSIGILIGSQNSRIYKEGFLENIKDSVNQSLSIYKLSYFSIIGIINRSSNPIFDGPKALGPIALGQISGNVVASEETVENKILILVTLASSISLSLSIINLLPFPALDGGRLAFLFIEIFRRGKKVPESIESYIHGVGFIILILLIIFISFRDISRL
tara:strand:+ start:1629 stop:3182 length:1554 start_codon:yes stop_codon:yes gene_type:complete